MSVARLVRRAPCWHVALSGLAALRVELALRRRSLGATAAALGMSVAPSTAETSATAADPRRLPRWTEQPLRATAAVMHRWPLGQDGPRGSAMCLRASLVTAWRLRSLAPTVHIGVALEPPAEGDDDSGPQLRAHAWVEVAGRALDPTAGRYRVMTSLVTVRGSTPGEAAPGRATHESVATS